MSHIISLNVTKFQQPLLITLGVADEKPEGGGKKPPLPRDIGLSSVNLNVTRSVNCRHTLEISNRLSFEIFFSERICLPTFSNSYQNQR